MKKIFKIICILHLVNSIWFGCVFAFVAFTEGGKNVSEGFLKGFFLGPIFFGNFLYLGSLIFSTLGIRYFLKE